MLNNLDRLHTDTDLSSEFMKFKTHLKAYSELQLIFSLGNQVYQVVTDLQKKDCINSSVNIICIPHPSGANIGQINAFLDPNNRQGKPLTAMRTKAWKMRKDAESTLKSISISNNL